MVRPAGTWAVCAVLLGACEQPWKPVHVIEGLRVIGVKAEPPEVHPGQLTELEALVLDPTRPGEKATLIWLGCEPDPYGANRGACGDLDTLGDQATLFDTMTLPPGVSLLGLGPKARYRTAPTLFDVLAADDPRRQKGTVGTVLLLTVAADIPLTATREQLEPLFQKIQRKEIASQFTLFRVRVSESSQPNRNPFIDDLLLEQQRLPKGATIPLQPKTKHLVEVTAHDFESFDEATPSGVERKTERIIVAWYTTAGRFDYDRVSLDGMVKSKLEAPGNEKDNDPIPESRRGTLWAVARDTRGGQTWAQWPWFVCDPSAPTPQVAQAQRSPSGLTLTGENLDQVLNVVADGAAVRGAYDSASKTWLGDSAQGELTVWHKNCGRSTVP